jgi:hypothetical protein
MILNVVSGIAILEIWHDNKGPFVQGVCSQKFFNNRCEDCLGRHNPHLRRICGCESFDHSLVGVEVESNIDNANNLLEFHEGLAEVGGMGNNTLMSENHYDSLLSLV